MPDNPSKASPLSDTLKIAPTPADNTISTLDSIIKLLIHDNYALHIDTSFGGIVKFNRTNEDMLNVKTKRLITIRTKRKNKIDNSDENYYPAFTIQQMTFDDNENIEDIKEQISKIIRQVDNHYGMNEYNWDEIRLDNRDLFYISTRAMIFSEFEKYYDKELEKIINAHLVTVKSN